MEVEEVLAGECMVFVTHYLFVAESAETVLSSVFRVLYLDGGWNREIRVLAVGGSEGHGRGMGQCFRTGG